MARLPSNVRVKVEGEPAFTTRLQDFLHANRDGLEASERRQLLAALLSGREFCSGGGAATAFCVTRPGKRSSLGGFGSPREEHKRMAPWSAREARDYFTRARQAIKAGNCPGAYADLTSALFYMGVAQAHRMEYRSGVYQSARHRKQAARYPLRLLKLKARFRAACVVPRGKQY